MYIVLPAEYSHSLTFPTSFLKRKKEIIILEIMLLELLSVGQSGIISYRGRKLHFHAPIGALVFAYSFNCLPKKTTPNMIEVQGVEEKLSFFTIYCNPSLAYIAVRDLQSSHRNASIQSLLFAGKFLYKQ